MRRGEIGRVQLVKVEGVETQAAGGRGREARDDISPVYQPASLVYAPGHPLTLQVAIPLRLSNVGSFKSLSTYFENPGNICKSWKYVR